MRHCTGFAFALLALVCSGQDASAGKIGPEFQVNTYTFNAQYDPAAAPLNNGFVVVWVSASQNGATNDIYGQRFTTAGARLGGEFRINSRTKGLQHQPAVARLSNGGFVVVWRSPNPAGGQYATGIYGRRFNANGAATSGEFQVNTGGETIEEPSVAGLTDGGFIVAWDSLRQDGSLFGVFAQRFNAAGGKAGSEFLVNTQTGNNQQNASVAALGGGGFVVVWNDQNEIYGQRYNASGQRAGGEFPVSVMTYNSGPSAAGLQNGGFVVSWARADGIVGQRFNAAGIRIGNEFAVSGVSANPAISALSSGGFVVAWHAALGSPLESKDVYARSFSATGAPLGAQVQINTFTDREQQSPSVAGLANGTFVTTWESNTQDGDRSGIFAQHSRP